MEQKDIEIYIKRMRAERKRKEQEKKRKIAKRLMCFFTILLSFIPFIFTIITKIDFIPLFIFDILWFNLILLIFIWTN
ncbi:hypothetical protein [Oceanirhabdus sp. W0125-5]|uniref:hypothetical protein n=1 Tax=Oceanirhabdus sp. W0125-5 TaxID=2999116 RepID=UPI0022F2BC2B|nr:hypothetical protein [Oceanirhabdus sp. W0125-5]WBW97518.1 hypothetical protein OW730_01420 [Oceanirhabdus sp. W0125-5]